jgi:hypothetical protein
MHLPAITLGRVLLEWSEGIARDLEGDAAMRGSNRLDTDDGGLSGPPSNCHAVKRLSVSKLRELPAGASASAQARDGEDVVREIAGHGPVPSGPEGEVALREGRAAGARRGFDIDPAADNLRHVLIHRG